MNICEKCKIELQGNYCSNCGQPAKLKRIDNKYMRQEIGQVIQFEKGFFFTIKELIIRPGKSVREFITKDRNRLVKPILFIIITSLVYSLLEYHFKVEDTFIKYEGPDNYIITSKIFNWIQGNYGYSNILMGLFIAIWAKIFFRKYGYNIYEILILICFALGIVMLIWSILTTIEALTNFALMHYSSLITIIYISWAIGCFFEKKVKNYLKAIVVYFLGTTTYLIIAFLLGRILDLFF